DLLQGGTGDDTLYGENGEDRLEGGEGKDSLDGGAGNDRLDGGVGSDTMAGGFGDDVYVVDDSGDTVTEGSSAGRDKVESSVTYTLGANIEDLTLTGTSDLNGTGNSLDNVIIGNAGNNTLTGNAGNDRLDGGLGKDIMVGGTGDDTYVVDDIGDVITENVSEGKDRIESSITYALSSNIEDLTLTGSTSINGTGNSLDNIITGNAGNNTLTGNAGNDRLDGGKGSDTLIGGIGDDVYVVDDAGDSVTENASEGKDRVESSISYVLGANLEDLTLTGTSNINATGNDGDNTIKGNDGNNRLDGGKGKDALVGGKGDDTYLIDDVGDIVTENSNEGRDKVESSLTYTLGNNLEDLILTGISDLNGTGNDLNNSIKGNAGKNSLSGGNGDDRLAGGGGSDSLDGGSGIDTATYENSTSGVEIDLGKAATDTTYRGKGGEAEGDSFKSIENLIGSAFNDILKGDTYNNRLDGGKGSDRLAGGGGNDVYIVDESGDTITENVGEGTDSVEASVSYTLSDNVENITLTGLSHINATGNALNNILNGNDGNNVLDGKAGSDVMTGGKGDDVYVVDSSDQVIEKDNEGYDTILASLSYTLGNYLENLTLTGTSNLNGVGNNLDNILTGNDGNNTLNGMNGDDILFGKLGDDILYGNYGNDELVGGDGKDILYGESGNDILQGGVGADTLDGGLGIDTASYQDSTVGVEVDLLKAAIDGTYRAKGGDAEGDKLSLIENLKGSSFADKLTGDTGNNRLDGGKGADQLVGGKGNDIYIVDDAADTITENSNEGRDGVESTISWTLGNNLEDLILKGNSTIDGTGNMLANTLTGNNGNNTLKGLEGDDTLDGGAGNDTLIGGEGSDTYIFGRGYGQDKIDNTHTDQALDQIVLGDHITTGQLWFSRQEDDLVIRIMGSEDKLTIQGWYKDTNKQVAQLVTSNGDWIDATSIERLRGAMASLTEPTMGQTSLSTSQLATLDPILSTSWHNTGQIFKK
ncbi:MAG: hypothetical protein K1X44_06000, partial [Alphaproteobacteria bacterium]|nr:hypothetical protein [Alphaproteobacteria bacterium]